MFGLTHIATNNLMAAYEARFRIDPASDGYLFTASDYGSEAHCSDGQYQAYTEEFAAFLDNRRRFMVRWFVLMLVVVTGALGWQLVYRSEPLPPLLERYLAHVGGVFMLLPFSVFVLQGVRLWRRPTQELATSLTGLGARRSSSAVRDQRLRGMSWSLVIGGLVVCAMVVGEAVGKWQGGYEQAWVGPAAGGGVLGFAWLAWRKRQAHGRESRESRARKPPES